MKIIQSTAFLVEQTGKLVQWQPQVKSFLEYTVLVCLGIAEHRYSCLAYSQHEMDSKGEVSRLNNITVYGYAVASC